MFCHRAHGPLSHFILGARPHPRNFRGSAVRSALSISIASMLSVPASALTINPIWDSSITNDPNAARIEADINSVITNYYEANFSNNVTLSVNIAEDGSVGGAYNEPNFTYQGYSQTIFALQSHASTLDNVALLSRVPTGTNPITGDNTGFVMEVGLASALGLTGSAVNTGSIVLGLTSGAQVNDNYVKQLFTHEMNEEMGTVSGLNVNGTPNVIDLSRYSAPGVRSFTTSTSAYAFFSPDGVNMGPEYFQNPNYDYGDFNSVNLVQGYATGAYVPTVERRMLNVAGWTYTGPTVMNQTDSSPNTLVTLPIATVSTAGGVIPNASNTDVQITEGGGTGTVTLASTSTVVNTLTNMAATTAVTVNLAGHQLVAGNGAVDSGVGLIEVGAGASAMTIGASVDDGTVTAGTSGACTLGLISANPSSTLDIKSSIVDNAGGGSVSVLELNTGMVILEGTNSYSGTTTIGSGSTLQIGNGGTTGTLGSGTVEVDGTLTFNRSNTITIANGLSGAGAFIQAGSGSAILTGGNSGFTGAFTINAGATLQVGAGATSGDLGSASVTDNGSLIFNRSDTLAFGNSISGPGSLTQAGTGILSLTTTPAYTGGTFVQSGILQIAGAATLGSGSYSVSNGAVVQYSSTANQTYSGIISGAGGLTKGGSTSTLTLTSANTFTGATTVNNGTLELNFSASGAPASNIIAPTSTLVLGEAKVLITGASGESLTQTLAGTTFTGTQGNLTLSQNGAAALDVNLGPLTFNAGSGASFNGLTGSTVGARLLTSTGTAGSMLAPGAMYNGTDWASKDSTNTYIVAYTGYTDIFTGTTGSLSVNVPNSAPVNVRIQENGATGAPNTLANATTTINSLLMNAGTTASTISMANGALVINGGAGVTGAVAVASGARSLTIGSSANDGSITAGASSASTLLLISNNSSAAQGIVVNSAVKDNAGNGLVTLGVSGGTGGGTVTLNGTNTFTGNLEITNGGTLQIGGAGSLGSGSYAGSILDSGALRYSSSTAQTLSGPISGLGTLTKDTSTNTLTLTGINTYTGNTVISAGVLQISGSGVLGGGNYAGIISGAGALTYNSSATQTLSGPCTYNGATAVNGGTLAWIGSTTLGGTVTVNNGGTFSMSGSANLSAGIAVNSGGTFTWDATTRAVDQGSGGSINIGTMNVAASGTINLVNTKAVSLGNNDVLFNNQVLKGAGTVNQSGGGVVDWWVGTDLSGFSGTYNVQNGILSIQGSTAGATTTTATVHLNNSGGNFGQLDLRTQDFQCDQLTGAGTVGSSYTDPLHTLTVGTNNGSSQFDGVIEDGGIATGTAKIALTKTGTGTLTLTGANSYTGTTSINGGALNISGLTTGSDNANVSAGAQLSTAGLIIASGATATLSITSSTKFSSANSGLTISGAGLLSLASGYWYLGNGGSGTTVNMASGGFMDIHAGATLSNDYANANWSSNNGSLNVSGSFDLRNNNATVDALTGSGAIFDNGYSNTLTIGVAGTVNNAAYGVANNAATFRGTIGAGGTTMSLVKNGSGTQVLTGTNTYTGTTTINSGTLVVSGSIAGSTTTVNNTATLSGRGTLGAVSIQSGGTLQPADAIGPGLLSSGNFSLLSGGHLSLEIGGVTGTGTSSTLYSEVNVTGSVSLAGDLQISLFNGYTPKVGDTFYIILNDGSDAISGTFSNATGGLITSSGIQYQVSYQANGNGGSNDVSLMVVAVPEPSATVSMIAGLGVMGFFGRRLRGRRPAPDFTTTNLAES